MIPELLQQRPLACCKGCTWGLTWPGRWGTALERYSSCTVHLVNARLLKPTTMPGTPTTADKSLGTHTRLLAFTLRPYEFSLLMMLKGFKAGTADLSTAHQRQSCPIVTAYLSCAFSQHCAWPKERGRLTVTSREHLALLKCS